jgi:hypothetical protein
MARKYSRDNRGRFASKGAGATARGGRLKTASGNKRGTQTVQGAKRSSPSGAIRKTDVLSARVQNGISKNVQQKNPRAGEGPAARVARAERRIASRQGARPDMAVTNIPMAGRRGRSLDAEISRNVRQQKTAARAADKTVNRQFKSDQSRAKKLRSVHEKVAVAKYSAKMNKSPSEVRGAIRSLTPSAQVKFFRQYVKENRATARKS